VVCLLAMPDSWVVYTKKTVPNHGARDPVLVRRDKTRTFRHVQYRQRIERPFRRSHAIVGAIRVSAEHRSRSGWKSEYIQV
jgi:hypothetical protein